MFPILTAAAIVPSVQLPPEGAADAPVRQPAESAFVEAVARAFFKGASRPGARTAASDDEGSPEACAADPAIGAWAAELNSQPARAAQEQAGQIQGAAQGAAAAPNATSAPISWNAVGSPDGQCNPGATGSSATSPNPALSRSETERPAISPAIAGAAPSLRMANLLNLAFPLNAAAENGGSTMQGALKSGATGPAGIAGSAGASPGTASPGAALETPAPVGAAPSVPAAAVKMFQSNEAQAVSAGAAAAQAAAGSAAIPAERPALAGIFQEGPAAWRSGSGGAAATASGSAPESGSEGGAASGISAMRDADAARQTVRSRAAAKAKFLQRGAGVAAPWEKTVPATSAGLQASAAIALNARLGTVAARAEDVRPDAAAAEGASARPEAIAAAAANARMVWAEDVRPDAVAVGGVNARMEALKVRPGSARPDAAAESEANAGPDAATAQRMNARLKAALATEPNARPEAVRVQTANIPADSTQMQPTGARPDSDAAVPPASDISGTAAPSATAGAAPEPLAAGRESAMRKGTGAARAESARPQDNAAQAAGQNARAQAVRQENAYKGQAPKPEPDAERDQDAARSRPVGGRQPAAPGAILTVGEGPGSPPAEQAAAPAPADGHQTAFEPGPAAQLARAALSAVRRGEAQFRLKLRPDGVGEVAVTISARDRDLRLVIRAGSESTRDLILSQIGGLKQELTQGGYRLEGFSVDVSGGQGGQAFESRQGLGRQPGRRPDAGPEPRNAVSSLKEAPSVRIPEARAGSINLRI